MRKSLLAAIIAASALVPAAAFAQDHREWHGGGDRGGQPRGDGGQRPQAQAQAPQAQPQAQPQPQAQARSQAQQGQPMRYQRPGNDGANRAQFQDGRGFREGGYRGGPGQQQGVPPQGEQAQRFQGDGRGGDGRGGDGRNWQGTPGQPRAQGQRFDGNRDGDRRGWQGGQPGAGGNRFEGNDPRRDGRGAGYAGRDNDRGGWNGNRGGGWNGGGNDRRDWSRDWRRDNRYNYNAYRSSNRNLYHLPRYYAPSGWGYGYRRFGVGLTLNSILYDQNYWIDDANDYRLPPAYGPYRWVRYYNDALLVDIYTGQVVDTVYDIFW